MAFLKDMTTENDGQTICPGRVLLIIGAVIFLALACYGVYLSHNFDAMQYGTGYGSLMGGGLTGVWLKSKNDKQ